MNIRVLLLLLYITIPVKLFTQEVLLPLPGNKQKSAERLHDQHTTRKSTAIPLTLPFWDDFSYKGPYPDGTKWADNDVFVNSGFAVHPITYGVATFDILDAQGHIYEHARADNMPFPADHLTSQPIDLGSHSPADSIVLSFYYQPQGRGGDPGVQDSLVVQFLLPGNKENNNGDHEEEEDILRWQSVWSAAGESLKSFALDTFPYFKRVAIPITEEKYFRDDFRFRFRNYASFSPGQTIPNYSGTANIWNIDYVLLNHGRSVFDDAYYDIAFAAPAQSILKDYTSMPWSQYIADPPSVLRENFSVRIANLDNSAYNYTYRYVVQDEELRTIRTYSGGSWVINPFSQEGYQDYQPHTSPIVLPGPFPVAPAQHRHFRIVHSLREGATGDDFTRNDTIIYDQVFSNYYSYDDGSPERTHLVKGHSPARALQFTTKHPDVLEAVQIFLMGTINEQNPRLVFDLSIKRSLDPPDVLYNTSDPIATPDEDQNGFVTINLDHPVEVKDTFYVVISQTGNVPLANSVVIGFDLGNDASHRLFNYFGDGAGWHPSLKEGALMVRAVMERDKTVTTDLLPVLGEQSPVTVYPNPASGNNIHIRTNDHLINAAENRMHVFDITGRLLYSTGFTSTLDVSDLDNGVYLLRITNQHNRTMHTVRFIISR